jgi:hypothetical protein
MGAHEDDAQPSTESVPLKVLGSAIGSSVASNVKAPSPHCAVSDAPVNCALMVFPSSVPAVVFVPPLSVTTKDWPDCEINRGAFETEVRKLPQAEAGRLPGSIFQAPSTENGADKLRPRFRIPTSPRIGNATRKTYASTKLRFVCEIAFLPWVAPLTRVV